MREIKFKLVKDGKVVGYEIHRANELTGGVSIWHVPGSTCGPLDRAHLVAPCSHKGNNYIRHDAKYQFTGHHDKNGREIYEGDILKQGDESDKTRGGYLYLPVPSLSEILGDVDWDASSEIVGTFYQNPELLDPKAGDQETEP